MGVPSFFSQLYKNYSNTNFVFKRNTNNINNLSTNINNNNNKLENVDNLYIDANSLIHPQAAIICEKYKFLVGKNDNKLEYKIIQSVINYLKLLIDEIQPNKLIYIAIDGVVPMAKIKHQRIRRFKYIIDINEQKNLAKKHNVPYDEKWNTSAITPGTLFMTKLTKSIIYWINSTNFLAKKVIFSSSYTPCEGEHKILQHLKNNDDNTVNVIYGLDADLIFLSIASKKNNIYLLRETTEIENKFKYDNNNFSYVNMDSLKDILFIDMKKYMNVEDEMIKDKFSKERLLDDFIFLCYLCGNDFLPNIPTISFRNVSKNIQNGLYEIMENYGIVQKELYNECIDKKKYEIQYIITNTQNNNSRNKITFNSNFLLKFMKLLVDNENGYLNDMYMTKKKIYQCNSNNPYEIDKFNLDNLYIPINDNIQLGNPDLTPNEWKQNYYKNYYKINYNLSGVNKPCYDYIYGMVWTAYYYFDMCADWYWFFKHHHGPFISDIYNVLLKNNNIFNEISDSLNNKNKYYDKIKPFYQLMMVLPLESSFLLPTIFKNKMSNMKLEKYFPLNIDIDRINKAKNWQSIPMIDIIEPSIILNLTKDLILNDSDILRNLTYEPYVKIKNK
jgi:5'-3' exonuclease